MNCVFILQVAFCFSILAAGCGSPLTKYVDSRDGVEKAKAWQQEDAIAEALPKTLQECWAQLDGLLSEEKKKELRHGKVIDFHMSIGMSLRNRWKLWEIEDEQNELVSHLTSLLRQLIEIEYGIEEFPVGADLMSDVILETYQAHLREPSVTEKQLLSRRFEKAREKAEAEALIR